jgi:thioredoxin-related protein
MPCVSHHSPQLLFVIPVAAQESSWLTSFEDAKAAAKKDKKVILADFTGSDWCGWCIKLKNEVFSKPEFQTWAEPRTSILLELDFPRKNVPQSDEHQGPEPGAGARSTGSSGYPTILFLDAEGKQIGTLGLQARRSPRLGPSSPMSRSRVAPRARRDLPTQPPKRAGSPATRTALAKAKKEKKVILADFTGTDWCGWCIKLKDEVFSKPEFKEWGRQERRPA